MKTINYFKIPSFLNGKDKIDFVFKKFDAEFILKIINKYHFYVSKLIKYIPDSVLNEEMILKMIEVMYDKKDIYPIINNSPDKVLTNNVLDIALNLGYIPTKDSPKKILENKEYLKKIIEVRKNNPDSICYAIDNMPDKYLDNDLIEYATISGYYITISTPKKIKENKKYILNVIKTLSNYSYGFDKIKLNYAMSLIIFDLDEEIIKIIKENEIRIFILENMHFSFEQFKSLVDKMKNIMPLDQLIRYLPNSSLTEEMIDYLILNGLILSVYTHDKITNNSKYVYKIYLKTKDAYNILHFAPDKVIDEFNKNGLLKNIIEDVIKDKNLNCFNELLNRLNKYLTAEQIIYLLQNGGKINDIYNVDLLNEKLEKKYQEITKDFPDSYQSKLHFLKEKFGVACVVQEMNNLFNNYMIDVLGVDFLSVVYKYIYLNNKNIDFSRINTKNDVLEFKYLYDVLNDTNVINIDDLVSFVNIYNEKIDLLREIKDKYHDKEKCQKLFKTLVNNKILEINNIDDLENYEKSLNEFIENISDSSNIDQKKELIFKLVINKDSKEVKELLNNLINVEKLERLIKEVKSDRLKKILPIIKLISFVNESNDEEKLKEVLNNLKEVFENDFSKYEQMIDDLKNISDEIKYYYGLELKNRLTNIDNLDLKEKRIGNVSYFEVNSNCLFLQHVLNAYGNGGNIKDIKTQRLIGKAYICCSLIDNLTSGVSIDNSITLLFNDIPAESLALVSNSDMYSYGEDNNFSVNADRGYDFDITKEILKKTKKYNEYVLYRESLNNKPLYPCAIKVEGNEPTVAEIKAAEELNVPLIKIMPVKKIEMDNEENIEDKMIEFQEAKKAFEEMYQHAFSKSISK